MDGYTWDCYDYQSTWGAKNYIVVKSLRIVAQLMDFEWRPSVETVLRCISTFSGLWSVVLDMYHRSGNDVQLMLWATSFYIVLWMKIGYVVVLLGNLKKKRGPCSNASGKYHCWAIWLVPCPLLHLNALAGWDLGGWCQIFTTKHLTLNNFLGASVLDLVSKQWWFAKKRPKGKITKIQIPEQCCCPNGW